ncbi:unnamed protein product [Mytilus coruscus]|uniref:C2H2-type domain-containing protein n=1 Tax=Mytilus coruscus TaxID=42192 RepID=A0A6J8BZ88_MYTCO|nr:unnamed protein product [Mytilus coruscus]
MRVTLNITCLYFCCPDDSCDKVFAKSCNLEMHLTIGNHVYRTNPVSCLDTAVQIYAGQSESVLSYNETLVHCTSEDQHNINMGEINEKGGWALKGKRLTARFSESVPEEYANSTLQRPVPEYTSSIIYRAYNTITDERTHTPPNTNLCHTCCDEIVQLNSGWINLKRNKKTRCKQKEPGLMKKFHLSLHCYIDILVLYETATGIINLEPITEHVRNISRELFPPYEKIAVDGRIVKSKHKLSGIGHFMKDKPFKFGIKLRVLADTITGYTCEM